VNVLIVCFNPAFVCRTLINLYVCSLSLNNLWAYCLETTLRCLMLDLSFTYTLCTIVFDDDDDDDDVDGSDYCSPYLLCKVYQVEMR